MSDLFCLQHDFQRYLLSDHKDIEQSIIETDLVSTRERLNIYHNAYHLRLAKALSSNFPCLKACLGNEEFHQMSLDYINSHPTKSHSIRWYGDALAEYLTNYYDSKHHFFSELAQFEWNMTLAFDAADSPVFKLEQIEKIPAKSWGGMLLTLHPSLQRMNFFWNVIALWEAYTNNKTPPDIIKNSEYVPWILWRYDYMNRFYILSEDEAWAIDKMRSTLTFGELCEGLCQWHDENDVGLRAATLLNEWIHSGIISTISL